MRSLANFSKWTQKICVESLYAATFIYRLLTKFLCKTTGEKQKLEKKNHT